MDDQQLRIVAHAAPLVERVVREFSSVAPRHLDRIDMTVRGRLQLVEAVEEFDPDGGQSFAEFALPRVRGAIAGAFLEDGAVPMDPFDAPAVGE